MKFLSIATLGLSLIAAPAFADGHASGDAAEGEKVFKKCKSCHMIVADDETVIQKGGKTGPNLYGVYQRVPGSMEGFKYGNSIKSIAENDVMPDGWNEEQFVSYVADPKAWLKEILDDSKAKSKMSFKLKDAEDAANVWAYLVSVGPAE
ncbi:c-type cytochrome [uncultured Litoreibacter sp.]|uniref:c-type cytochrome n=1 Tax=uncultured Litoreibacter sp. TaxID=1392394 RepID=UPI002602E0C4|nr:c-type cytochrome [uncultured Litoreibacter sp.]